MKSRITLKTFNSFMVCILCTIYVLSNMYVVRTSAILTGVFDALDGIVLMILIAIILTSSFHTKMFLEICLLTGYMLICYLITGLFDLLRSEIVVLALMNTSAKKTYKMLFRTFIISLGIVFVLYILGISNAGEMRRENIALGFGTPNVASKMIQTAIFLWVLWKSGTQIKYRNIIYLMIIVFVWLTTGSRNSTIMLIIFPASLYLIKKILKSSHRRWLQYIFVSVPLVLTAITIILPYLYGKYAWVQGLNALVSNRIYMNSVAIQKYGFSIIGQAANIMEFSGIFDVVSQKYTSFLTIDCFYIYILVYYGVLGLTLTLFAITAVIKKAWKNNNHGVLTVTILLCVYCMMETTSSVFVLPFLTYLFVQDDISEGIKNGGMK